MCIIRCVELNRGKIDTAKNSECPDSKLLTSPAKIISQNIFGHFSNIVSSTSSSIFECSIVFTKWQIWIRNKKRDIDHKFFSLTKSNFDYSLQFTVYRLQSILRPELGNFANGLGRAIDSLWFWLSCQSSHFRCQRSVVRIQLSANSYLFTANCQLKR